ncbi:MAG: flavodoxin family protein [Clostridiales bacterium]|jgi:multimeric flavodoxin WrbA|nr:flavodoxin family protein [Clostridiales bacterium]
MLVLGLAGSPRRGGNSETLLDEALAGAKEAGATVEKVVLSTRSFSPCISCGECEKTGICVIDDDMQDIHKLISDCDAMVFASPIYFYSVSAWAKAAIDRSQALWSRKYILKDPRFTADKKGVFIGVGATKGSKLFDGTLLTMKYYFDAAGFYPAGQLLVRGVDEKGQILNHPDHLAAAKALGSGLL